MIGVYFRFKREMYKHIYVRLLISAAGSRLTIRMSALPYWNINVYAHMPLYVYRRNMVQSARLHV